MVMYVLYESASGYGLFEVVESEEIGSIEEEVQAGPAAPLGDAHQDAGTGTDGCKAT
jgi:hypothetical protein